MKLSSEKIEKTMRWIFIILTLFAVVYNFWTRSWEIFWSSVMTFLLFLLPSFFAKRNKIVIPPPFQIIITIFIFLSMYLGEIHHFFYRFTWWDRMLHSSSAIILGYIGFLLIYTLNKDSRAHVRLSPLFMALFSFCFAMTMGVLWEVFEYGVDAILGMNMQKARNLELFHDVFDTRLGVLDTMQDLIVDAIGAFIVSLIGYLHLKRTDSKKSRFWRMHQQFIEENPKLFESGED